MLQGVLFRVFYGLILLTNELLIIKILHIILHLEYTSLEEYYYYRCNGSFAIILVSPSVKAADRIRSH
jgi:hypothetical protein